MKLRCNFEAVDLENEIILVPVGRGADQIHGVIKSNTAGQEIVDLLQKDTTIEYILSELSGKYTNSYETLRKYVLSVIAYLRQNNLIEE